MCCRSGWLSEFECQGKIQASLRILTKNQAMLEPSILSICVLLCLYSGVSNMFLLSLYCVDKMSYIRPEFKLTFLSIDDLKQN